MVSQIKNIIKNEIKFELESTFFSSSIWDKYMVNIDQDIDATKGINI